MDRPVHLSQLQDDFSFKDGTEVFSVGAFAVFCSALLQLIVIDPAKAIGDFFWSRDGHFLVLFEHTDEVRRPAQGIDCPGVDPDESTTQ